MKPFLRWAGGKTRLVNRLLDFVPNMEETATYWEPFLGSGAMYFKLQPKKAVLSDLNLDLINCYQHIRSNPRAVADGLARCTRLHSAHYYLKARDEYNNSSNNSTRAYLFLYLNKASFNGIFRVNKKGMFNVPSGHRDRLPVPSIGELMAISALLRNAKLTAAPFSKVVLSAKKGDFVYLDPPYPALNGTSFFAHYTKERFSLADQEAVRDVALDLQKKGCLIMISNADLPIIRKLFSKWNINSIHVTRWITCKSKKFQVNELVITNY